jgi:hypothetical protein
MQSLSSCTHAASVVLAGLAFTYVRFLTSYVVVVSWLWNGWLSDVAATQGV